MKIAIVLFACLALAVADTTVDPGALAGLCKSSFLNY